MANTNAPFGFVPIGHITGSAIPEPHTYIVTTSQVIYKGDPVVMTSAGSVSVAAAGVTTTHIGIAAEYVSDVAAASGTQVIHVYDDPGILYRVQTKTGLTSAQAYIFYTADMITYAVGNSTTKQSVMALDTCGTSSKPWIITGLFPSPTNAWGDSSIVIVKYNQHVFLAPYAGL
jgi:hypothetical protein